MEKFHSLTAVATISHNSVANNESGAQGVGIQPVTAQITDMSRPCVLEGSANLLKQRALLAADAGTKTETTLNRRKNRSHKKGRGKKSECRGERERVGQRVRHSPEFGSVLCNHFKKREPHVMATLHCLARARVS